MCTNRQNQSVCFSQGYLHFAGYLIYSEANFEVFLPAGATRCTDGGEIWHGGGDRRVGLYDPQN